jgi:hypothetical protein
MKKLLALLIIACLAGTAYAEGETKQVCHDKLDKAGKPVKGKDGKPQQQCKNIKIHKKLDGAEAVPTKK